MAIILTIVFALFGCFAGAVLTIDTGIEHITGFAGACAGAILGAILGGTRDIQDTIRRIEKRRRRDRDHSLEHEPVSPFARDL